MENLKLIKGFIVLVTLVSIIIIGINYIINTKNELKDVEKNIKKYNLKKLVDDMNYNNEKLINKEIELNELENELHNNVNDKLFTLMNPDCNGNWNDNCEIHGKQYFTEGIDGINNESIYISSKMWVGETKGVNAGKCDNFDNVKNKFKSNNNKWYQTEGCIQPKDCVGDWSACTNYHSEGHNINNKIYNVSEGAQNGGYCEYPNGYIGKEDECDQPINCIGEWIPNSEGNLCHRSSHLNDNSTYKKYRIISPAQYDGEECPFSEGYETTTGCEGIRVDCESEWTSCVYSETDGIYQKTYNVIHPAANNGNECEFENGYKTTEGCSQPIDCVGYWGNNDGNRDLCDYDQNNHTNYKTYHISTQSKHHGQSCPYKSGDTTTEGCPQPIDCAEGTWGNWGNCQIDNDDDSSCVKIKQRTGDILAQYNGYDCSSNIQKLPCNSKVYRLDDRRRGENIKAYYRIHYNDDINNIQVDIKFKAYDNSIHTVFAGKATYDNNVLTVVFPRNEELLNTDVHQVDHNPVIYIFSNGYSINSNCNVSGDSSKTLKNDLDNNINLSSTFYFCSPNRIFDLIYSDDYNDCNGNFWNNISSSNFNN